MLEMTLEQEQETRRLVEEEGLSEEQARVVAAERQLDVPPADGPPLEIKATPAAAPGRTHRGAYGDIDSTDDFLDLPEPVYEPDGRPDDGAAVEALLESGAPLPALPASPDH